MNIAHLLGWTLIHSVWEIALISTSLLIANLLLRNTDARIRYVLALAALSACLLLPLATYVILIPPTASPTSEPVASAKAPIKVVRQISSAPISTSSPESMSIERRLEPFLPTLVICWLVGLALMCLRLGGGLLAIERIKRKARIDVGHEWLHTLHSIGLALGIRRLPDLKLSLQVDSPAVVGALKAVILFPAAAASKLSPSDVEALLAHELAHVVRHDYLANLLQSVIETVLFYHPCVWWISWVVRIEREHCCDDIAVSVLGDRNRYASALVGLEQLRNDMPRLALAANHGPLISRVRRVLLMPQRPVVPGSMWLILALILTISTSLAQSHGKTPTMHGSGPAEDIVGRVVDIDGKPVSGVTVLWQDNMIPSRGFRTRVVETDSGGSFKFANALTEPGILIAFRKNKGFGVLPPLGQTHNVIHLQPTKAVHVRVLSDSGKPVPRILVGPSTIFFDNVAYAISPDSLEWLGAKTDTNGRAVLEDLPEYCSATFDVQDDRFTVQANARTTEISYLKENVVVITQACSVEGHVTLNGKPITGADITAVPKGKWNLSGNGGTDQDGHFLLKRQPPGILNLACYLPDSLSYTWIVRSVDVVTNPTQPAHFEFHLEPGVKVSGVVVDKDGNPAPRVSVRFAKPDVARGMEAVRMTGPDGTFQVAIPPGIHQVTLFGGRMVQSESTLTVKDGESKFLKLTMPPPVAGDITKRFTCTVIDADGRLRGGVNVECSSKNGAGREEDRYQMSNSKGEARFDLPNRQSASVSFKASVGNQFSEGLIPAIDGKATLKLRRISLGSVSGTVLDRSGHPISGAKLDLSIAGRQEFVGDLREMTWLNNTTGPDGTFKYPSIYPGTPVVVMVHAEGFADGQSSGCHIVGGKDTKIPPIRLWPGKVVSGRVVDRQGNPVEGASVWIEKILKVSENVVHTDKDGRFRYTRVPLGKHTLWISNKTRAETFPITNDSGATYTLTPWQLFKGN